MHSELQSIYTTTISSLSTGYLPRHLLCFKTYDRYFEDKFFTFLVTYMCTTWNKHKPEQENHNIVLKTGNNMTEFNLTRILRFNKHPIDRWR